MIEYIRAINKNLFNRRRYQLSDLKEFINMYKERPMLLVITFASMVIGAVLGAVAFYSGWLG